MRTQHQAPIGDQWICSRRQCRAFNFPKRPECYKCGSKRTHDLVKHSKEERDSGHHDRRYSNARSSLGGTAYTSSGPGWLCTHCGGDNWAVRDKCYQCRLPRPSGGRGASRFGSNRRHSLDSFPPTGNRSRTLRNDNSSRRPDNDTTNGSSRDRRRRPDDDVDSEDKPRMKSFVSSAPNEEDLDITQFALSDFATVDETKRDDHSTHRSDKHKTKEKDDDRSKRSHKDHRDRKDKDQSSSSKLKSTKRDKSRHRDSKRPRRLRSDSPNSDGKSTTESEPETSTDKNGASNDCDLRKDIKIRARSVSSVSSTRSSSSGSPPRSRKRTSASKRRYK
jgi:hypothetical protein